MFKRHIEAQAWTKAAQSKDNNFLFKRDFHTFYYCFLVGVKLGKRKDVSDRTQSIDFTDNFVEEFHESKFQIIALLITGYLTEQKMKISDKKDLERIVDALINIKDQANYLSSEGFERMNQYAQAGFEEISAQYKFPIEGDPIKAIKKIYEILNP